MRQSRKVRTVRAWQTIVALLGVAWVSGCHLLLDLVEARLDCTLDDIVCPCTTADECGEAPSCRIFKCINGGCRQRNAPHGAPCPEGFCSNPDGTKLSPPATCGECSDESHCAGGYCYKGSCSRCDDGILNGDEWKTDCGGNHCLGCLGNACSYDAWCLSGHCTDGSCCESACDEMCAYCNDDGICEYVPQFSDDDLPLCDGKMTCNGGGVCALRPGEPCVSYVECASLDCKDGEWTGP